MGPLQRASVSRPLALLMAGVLLLFYLDGFVLGAPLPLLLSFSLLGGLVLLGFLRHGHHGPVGIPRPTPVAQAVLGALVVMALSRAGHLPVVLVTALVGCVGALLERLDSARPLLRQLAAPLYCGAFAGMTSELVLHHPGWVLLAGGFAGLLFTLLSNSWCGIGGKLGTTAFVGVFGVSTLAAAFGDMGAGAPLHPFVGQERVLVLCCALLSPMLTHGLSYRWGLGPVLGSALPSLLAAMLLPLIIGPLGLAPLPLAAVWLGASFVGMTAPERLAPQPLPLLLAMGLLFAFFTLAFEPRLAGIGGDLGATAAVSVFAVLGSRGLVAGAADAPP